MGRRHYNWGILLTAIARKQIQLDFVFLLQKSILNITFTILLLVGSLAELPYLAFLAQNVILDPFRVYQSAWAR